MSRLTSRESRERSRLWDKWEARLNYATSAMQWALILSFAVLSVFALTGKFVNAPEYVVIISWTLLLLGLLGSARPIFKRLFIQGRAATEPSHGEFWGTVGLSSAVVVGCAVLWWQGVFYRIERGIMVWTYWAFSLLLMQAHTAGGEIERTPPQSAERGCLLARMSMSIYGHDSHITHSPPALRAPSIRVRSSPASSLELSWPRSP